jgi:hypothetical protein
LNYQRWGYPDTYGAAGLPGSGVTTYALYAEIRQPWGTVQIGRLVDGLGSSSGGLASFGYVPAWGGSEFLAVEVFDTGNPTDSVVYSHDFGNGFAIAAYYAKDAIDGNYVPQALVTGGWGGGFPQRKDADRDRFGIEPRYQWDTGGVSLGVVYVRDMTFEQPWGFVGAPFFAWNGQSTKKAYEIQINPAFVQNWGPFSVHFEGVVGFGKYTLQEWLPLGPNNTYRQTEYRSNGLGLYLDASYNYGAGDITLMGWFADGTSYGDLNDANGAAIRNPKHHSSIGMGSFYPFLVAYNGTTLGTGTWSNNVADNFGDPLGIDAGNTNHWGIGLLGNHAINDDIKLNYGLGYFRLVSMPFDTRAILGNRANRSKSLGFEIDLGATFQLLDNLSLETQFGYMFNGNAYRSSTYADDGANNPVAVYGPKPKDTFAWANVLSVTF